MPRLLLLLLVVLGGAAIWRRREIRNDAERASKAIAGAAGAATSKIRPSDEDGDGEAAAEHAADAGEEGRAADADVRTA